MRLNHHTHVLAHRIVNEVVHGAEIVPIKIAIKARLEYFPGEYQPQKCDSLFCQIINILIGNPLVIRLNIRQVTPSAPATFTPTSDVVIRSSQYIRSTSRHYSIDSRGVTIRIHKLAEKRMLAALWMLVLDRC
jgi:hypothetical protein